MLFQRDSTGGEHVICILKTVRRKDRKYKTASVTTKVRISDADGNVVIAWADMDEESDGVHTYAYDLNTDPTNGTYTCAYATVNTDDSLKTISEWTFEVEDL